MTDVVRAQIVLTADQLAAVASISNAELYRLVALGLIEPTPGDDHAFAAAAAARLRRMVRLHHDLDIDFVAAAIIVDLLERIARLEAQEK